MSLLALHRASRPRNFNRHSGAIESDIDYLQTTAREAFDRFREMFANESHRFTLDNINDAEIVVCPEDWDMILMQVAPYITNLTLFGNPSTDGENRFCGVRIRREKGDFLPRISYPLGSCRDY